MRWLDICSNHPARAWADICAFHRNFSAWAPGHDVRGATRTMCQGQQLFQCDRFIHPVHINAIFSLFPAVSMRKRQISGLIQIRWICFRIASAVASSEKALLHVGRIVYTAEHWHLPKNGPRLRTVSKQNAHKKMLAHHLLSSLSPGWSSQSGLFQKKELAWKQSAYHDLPKRY